MSAPTGTAGGKLSAIAPEENPATPQPGTRTRGRMPGPSMHPHPQQHHAGGWHLHTGAQHPDAGRNETLPRAATRVNHNTRLHGTRRDTRRHARTHCVTARTGDASSRKRKGRAQGGARLRPANPHPAAGLLTGTLGSSKDWPRTGALASTWETRMEFPAPDWSGPAPAVVGIQEANQWTEDLSSLVILPFK